MSPEAPAELRGPSPERLRERAAALGFDLDAETAAAYAALVDTGLGPFRQLAALAEPPRRGGTRRSRRPGLGENRLNAWATRTELAGAADGPLSGRTVALKDNICLADVPLMAGTSVLADFIPDLDATVATRVLEAGATLVGKAHCEALCRSGASHNSLDGPIPNPAAPGYSAGGSSSGCGALVAAGEVDLALGTDQVGSIRLPAAFCGIVGLKPTFGLVPYTGIFPLENSLDHVGPMTRTVSDCALLLDAIAGPDDGRDPRQPAAAPPPSALAATMERLDGLRVGVLTEGFGHPGATPGVDEAVRTAVEGLAAHGAAVSTVSVPEHQLGLTALLAVLVQGNADALAVGSLTTNWGGEYALCFADAFAELARHPDRLPERVKIDLLVAEEVDRLYGRRLYGRAQNLGRRLGAAYDRVLGDVDLLVMPTTPRTAPLLPGADASREERLGPEIGIAANTAPFNLTGHPAISIPCGAVAGLPTAVMLVGRRFDERSVFRGAAAVEATRS